MRNIASNILLNLNRFFQGGGGLESYTFLDLRSHLYYNIIANYNIELFTIITRKGAKGVFLIVAEVI